MTRIYVIVGLIALLLLSSTFGAIMFKNWRNAEHQNKELINYASANATAATKYMNKYKREVESRRASEFDNKTLRRMVKEGAIKIDQFNKVKAKQVQGLGWLTIASLDTATNVPVDMNGKFMSVTEFGQMSGQIKPGTGTVITPGTTISIRDSLSIPVSAIVYWKRKGLLRWLGIGRKEYWGDVTSDNPKVIINKFNLVVKKK